MTTVSRAKGPGGLFDWNRPMQTVVILIHLMIVLAMVGLVLLQRSEGGGLGMGGAAGFMSSRGTANVLTRATAILAGLFFATSLLLSILAGIERKPASIVVSPPGPTVPASPPTPSQPAAPQQPAGGIPAGPQVPRSQ
jgi:preprotein translocase subunit SecG